MSSLAIGNATATPMPSASPQGQPAAASLAAPPLVTPPVAAPVAATPVAGASESQQREPPADMVQKAMREVQQAIASMTSNNLQFNLDEETGKMIVRIVDAQTNEVIRQIPSEEMLAIAKSVDTFQGLLLKQKA